MRNFFAKTKGLWGILTLVFLFVMVFAISVGAILEANEGQVNNYLGTETQRIVYGEDFEEYAYSTYTPEFETASDLVDEHVAVGTALEAEGSVLLKNSSSNGLPLTGDEKVTVFGAASSSVYTAQNKSIGHYGMLMGGILKGTPVTLYEALVDRGVDANKAMFDDIESQAAAFSGNGRATRSGYLQQEVTIDEDLIGSYTDVGIVVVGRDSSESNDWAPDAMDYTSSYNTGARDVLALTDMERALITASEENCDKTIVLLNTTNPMEIRELVDDEGVDAILWVGFPGIYGYYGVADVLLGRDNPSGRLVDTYASDSTSSPAMQNFGVYTYANMDEMGIGSDVSAQYYLVEAESIYTGYKYYETRYEDAVLGDSAASSTAGAFDSASGWTYGEEVVYSFGEGISYTEFEQKIGDENDENGFKLSDDKKTATVTVTVTNTGDVAGKSVVQVYGQSPYTEYDKTNGIEKASVQLLGYEKTGVIEPNQSETVTVDIEMQYLASYDSGHENVDESGNKDGTYGTYIMEPTGTGTANSNQHYYIALGCNNQTSSEDAYQEGAHAAVNNILTAKGKTKENTSNAMDSAGSKDAVYEFDWAADDEYIFSESNAGVEVSNQLDDMDLNYYETNINVTYLTRSDWEWKDTANNDTKSLWNTGDWVGEGDEQKGYTGLEVTEEMAALLKNSTYEIQTGDDMSGITLNADNGLAFLDMVEEDEDGRLTKVLDYDDPLWDELLDQLDLAEAVQFIYHGNRSYTDMPSVGFLGGTYTENGPTGIAATGEAGSAPWLDSKDPNSSYYWADSPCATVQASTFNKDLLERLGEQWGNDGLYANLPIIWAPCLNEHRHPYNGRQAEYYSEDPIVSGYSAVAICNGAEKFGLMGTVKHFAFNDQEANRAGVAPFMNEQKARENELRGFQITFEHGAKATMTAFNRVGCTYASADEGLMTGILRGEWGFTGYAVTDIVTTNTGAAYQTLTESVLAGTTNFDANSWHSTWGADSYEAYAEMISGDATMVQAVKDAVHRSLWTFAHSNVVNYMDPDAYTVSVMNWWRVTYYTLEIVGGVVAGASLVLYVVAEVVGKKKKD